LEPVYANASAVAAATVLTVQEGEQRIGEFGWYEVTVRRDAGWGASHVI
jgi:hypothetical protein